MIITIKRSLLIFTVVNLIATSASAGSASVSKSMSATVDPVFSLSISLVDERNMATQIPTIAFGSLVRGINPNGSPQPLRSASNVRAFIGALTSAQPYTITWNMTPLTSGTNTLPNAIVCAPVSSTGNVGLGPIQSALTPNKLLFTSNATGDPNTVEVVLGISGGPAPFSGWQPIPPAQAAGTYTSTAVISLTTT